MASWWCRTAPSSTAGGTSSPRDPVLRAVLLAAVVLSVGACAAVAWTQTTLAYPDAVSHLLITRRVLDASTPGAAQLGGVWLPLSHVLALPFVVDESWYHAGVVPSVVSMCAYVATAGWLYRIGSARTGRRTGAVTAALVFCANPNVLYLQSTPMTESVLLACLAAATWHLLRWCRDGGYRHLVATAVAVLGATLVRYEGWAFLAAVAVVVGVCSWRRSRAKAEPWVLVRADLVFFGCLAVSGVVGWALWNAAIFGDPLNFVRGEFAKPALWVGADERAVGDWAVSLSTYLHAVDHDLGPVVLVLAGAGLVCFAWRTRLRAEAPAVVPLLVFLPFFVWALHSGQRPLHVPEIGGDLYNVRFALVMVLPAALFTAYLVVPANRTPLRCLPAVAVLVGGTSVAVGVLVGPLPTMRLTELLVRHRVPNAQQMDTLADALASLEYYLEALRDQRPNSDKIQAVTRESLEGLGYWPVPELLPEAAAEAAATAAASTAPAAAMPPAAAGKSVDRSDNEAEATDAVLADGSAVPADGVVFTDGVPERREDSSLQDLSPVQLAPGAGLEDLVVGDSGAAATAPPPAASSTPWIATNTSPIARSRPNMRATPRCPLSRSTRASRISMPSSMMTKRNSTMIAPA
mgnify:CR=1 FL=1